MAIGIVAALCAGCGSTTDRQTKTVERETLVTGPVVLDTPIGQMVLHPFPLQRAREQLEVEQTKQVIDLPDAGPLLQAAAGATPWGGILAGILGLGASGMIGKAALGMKRQRDELIAGIERAKPALGDTWNILTQHLEAEQSVDTKRAVRERTA